MWDAIRQWEGVENGGNFLFPERNWNRLLELASLNQLEDPEFRISESIREWLHRYYHFRKQHEEWGVRAVNQRALDFQFGDWLCRINYHLEATSPAGLVKVYIKLGIDWELPNIISTLSMIRARDEYLASLSGTAPLPTTYLYKNVFIDSGHPLSNNEYNDWLGKISRRLQVARLALSPELRPTLLPMWLEAN